MDENSDPPIPTSTHAFFQRTNSHPPLDFPRTNQQQQAPDKYMKVTDYPYEELQNSTRHPDDPDLYTAIDEGSVIVATEKKSHNETNTKKEQAQAFASATGRNPRQRTNYLYDPSGGSLVQTHYPPRKDGLCVQGSCCLQTFAFLFALVALVLVLWSILSGRSCGRSGGPEYQVLVEEIEELKSNLSNLHFQIDFLKSQGSHANETFENLKRSIDVENQMEIRGLVNMSACSHKRKSYGRSNSFDYSITDPLDLSHVFVLGVLCTTNGGTEALLVDQTSDNNSNYTCICHGRRGAANQRYCTIHYWTCPILS